MSESRKALRKKYKDMPPIEAWFVVDCDGRKVECSSFKKANERKQLMDRAYPSYAPHRIIYMKQVEIPDAPRNKINIGSSARV